MGALIAAKLCLDSLNRKAFVVPRLKATFQRPHFLDAPSLQQQRHTGAGRFVRSGAKQNDLAVSRNLLVTLFNLVGCQTDRARNRSRRGFEIKRAS